MAVEAMTGNEFYANINGFTENQIESTIGTQ